MYCENCGQKIESGGLFCPSCGTKQDFTAATTESGTAITSTKQKKKRIAPVLIAVALIAAIAITSIATKGFGVLSRSKSNPIAATFDGITGLLGLKSFEAEFDITENGDRLNGSGTVVLGKSLGDVEIYANADFDGEEITFAIKDEEFLYLEEKGGYVTDAGEERLMDMMDETFIDLLNPFLSSIYGNFDLEKAIKTLAEDAYNSFKLSYEEYSDHDLQLPEYKTEWGNEFWKLLNNFLYHELNKEEILDDVLTSYETSKKGGDTSYTFTINLKKAVRALENYLLTALDADKNLQTIEADFESLINEFDEFANVEEAIKGISSAIIEEITYGEIENVDVYALLNDGVLQELKMEFGSQENSFRASIKTSKHNNATVNKSDFDALLNKVIAEQN